MPRVIEELLTRAQRAGSVRGDLGMPELRALLGAASMAAERHQWDQQLRTRDAGHAVPRAAPAPLAVSVMLRARDTSGLHRAAVVLVCFGWWLHEAPRAPEFRSL
jgi:hypothetical protein